MTFRTSGKFIALTVFAISCALSTVYSTAPASAATIVYTADLTGSAENPPVSSTATGSVQVTIDDALFTMRLTGSFSGLSSNTTLGLLHCCTMNAGLGNAISVTPIPGVAGFPLGVTSGAFDSTFDMSQESNYNPMFFNLTGGGAVPLAFFALLTGLADGKAYFNIHTVNFGGGEIRGFLVAETPGQTPLPAALPLFATGLGALALLGWRRKKKVAAIVA